MKIRLPVWFFTLPLSLYLILFSEFLWVGIVLMAVSILLLIGEAKHITFNVLVWEANFS